MFREDRIYLTRADALRTKLKEHIFAVNFGDTDLSGWVYSARYVDYLMDASFEYFENLGIDWNKQVFGRGYGLPPVELHFKFRSPAQFRDKVQVFLSINRVGSSSITFDFKMNRLGDGTLLNEGTVTLVYANLKGKKSEPLPDFILRKLDLRKNG